MSNLNSILSRVAKPEAEEKPYKENVRDFIVKQVLRNKPETNDDLQRICSLPLARSLDAEEMEAIQLLHVKPEAYERGFRLQAVQADALSAFAETGRLFGPIEVGGGKTLVSLRVTAMAFEDGIHRAVLIVPPQVVNQLVNTDIRQVRQWVSLGVTFYNLSGLSPDRRRSMCGGGRRGCWILPYSLLSTKDTSAMLEALRPDLMVLDEAHNLKNRDAARTRRVLSYWKKHHPRVVALSGTMTKDSIKDYAHILEMTHGEMAPVPLHWPTLQDWASVLDSDQNQETYHSGRTASGPLRPLIVWAAKNIPGPPRTFDVQGFRAAFNDRLMTTPGVVCSPADSLGTSLVIVNKKADAMTRPGGARLEELQKQLEELWVAPNGDEIEFAMSKWKWAYELASGLYLDLVWPDAGLVAQRRSISVDAAEDLLQRSKDHHALQQAYHKELRKWISNHPHRPGLDTPMLIGSDMKRHGPTNVGKQLYEPWIAMKNAEFEGMVERDSVPVRVCDYKVMSAIEWMKQHPTGEGIVWFYHNECGRWIQEEAEKAGISTVHCPAGTVTNKFLTSEGAAERCKGKFLIASIMAHGTGKNLQFMTDQCYVQFPWNEATAQQSIGRTHRKGQKADTVTVTTMVSCEADELALAACLNDAVYVLETFRSQRKVLIATWDPMPTLYGSQMLQRAGISAKTLSAKQRLLLRERFSQTGGETED